MKLKPRIVVCSLFRDSMLWHGVEINQVHRYFRQIKEQETSYGQEFSIIAVEGGSVDNTRETLVNYQNNKNLTILDDDVNFVEVKSVASKERFESLARVANIGLNAAKKVDAEYILWLESDLIIDKFNVIDQLVSKMEEEKDIAAISPLITMKFLPPSPQKYIFYDTWGYVFSDGSSWGNISIQDTDRNPRYREMLSVGSCCLMRSKDMDDVDFGTGCFRELCEKIKLKGKRIVLDMRSDVYHPSDFYIQGRRI